jgi:hypothetical protein
MSPINIFLLTLFITLALGLPLITWILIKIDRGYTKYLEGPEPYTDIKEALKSNTKENYVILFLYSLYFVIVILGSVHFFGKIEYGPNRPYLTLLILIGIPFLVAFVHLVSRAGNQSIRFQCSGYTERQAAAYRLKWLFIFTITTICY